MKYLIIFYAFNNFSPKYITMIKYIKKFRLLILLLILSTGTALLAQTPQKIRYQVLVKDASNNLVANQNVALLISVQTVFSSKKTLYQETQLLNTNGEGKLVLVLGEGKADIGSFSGINWGMGAFVMNIKSDPDIESSYTVIATSQYISLPLSIYAKKNEQYIPKKEAVEIEHPAIEKIEMKVEKEIAPKIEITNQGERKIIEEFIISVDNINQVKEDIVGENDRQEIAILIPKEEIDFVLTDIDGNIYKTIKIGSQLWMADNLKTITFNDSTPIPNVRDTLEWKKRKTPGYCWYKNDESFKNPYGALYNWYTVNTGKLCPTGWHVSTDNDWKELEAFLGMSKQDIERTGMRNSGTLGLKLKSDEGWLYTVRDGNGNNSSGFNALPGSYRGFSGIFAVYSSYWGFSGLWWTSTSYEIYYALNRELSYMHQNIIRNYIARENGMSVRCVKD